MKALIPTLAAATLALAATFAFAQGTQGYGPGMGGQGMGPGMRDQANRGETREKMRAIYEACKDKPDRHACMTEQYCAKSPNPAECQAKAKEHAQYSQQRVEQRQKMHEACNGKRGEDLTKCMQGQMQAQRNQRLDERQKAHEACNGKRGDDLAKCLGEQHQHSGPRGPRTKS
jgi:Spy/CpxP family protein refolding chaperone